MRYPTYPKKGSLSFEVAMHVHTVPGATADECIEALPRLNPALVKSQLTSLATRFILIKKDNGFTASEGLSRYLCKILAIPYDAPPPAQPKDASIYNKPWTGKYGISTAARRPDTEVREVGFKNGSQCATQVFRGIAK